RPCPRPWASIRRRAESAASSPLLPPRARPNVGAVAPHSARPCRIPRTESPMPAKNGAPKHVGVLGSGTVGETLANGFLKFGYQVMRGSREPDKLAAWKEKAGPAAQVGSFADTARFGEIVVLAVKGLAAA